MAIDLDKDGNPVFRQLDAEVVGPDKLFEELRASDSALDNELKTVEKNNSFLFGEDEPAPRLKVGEAFRYLKDKKRLLKYIDEREQEDPGEYRTIKKAVDAVKGTGKTALNVAGRVLNFFPALEVGGLVGLKRQLTGEGTVYEGVVETLKENAGFKKALDEFYKSPIDTLMAGAVGVPSGVPDFKIKFPLARVVSPSTLMRYSPDIAGGFSVGGGVAQAMKEGKTFAEAVGYKEFNPVVTSRGVVGFALDVALDPITYLTLGASVFEKNTLKVADQSAIKFGGKQVVSKGQLTKAKEKVFGEIKGVDTEFLPNLASRFDDEFTSALRGMRVTRTGQAFLEQLDSLTSFALGENTLKGLVNIKRAFVTSSDKVANQINDSIKFMRKSAIGAEGAVYKRFEGISDKELHDYFVKVWTESKKEFELKVESKLTKKQAKAWMTDLHFDNPKIQKAHEFYMGKGDELGELQKLAKRAGMSEDAFQKHYMPSFFEGVLAEVAPAQAKKHLGRIDSSFYTKSFVEKGLITDPRVAISRRMVSLTKMAIHNESVAKLIRKYGKNFQDFNEATAKGYRSITSELLEKNGKKLSSTEIEKLARESGELALNTKALGDRLVRGPKANKNLNDMKDAFLPKKVIKEIERLNGSLKFETNKLLKIYDEMIMNRWKLLVTSVWPAFHGRNAISNQFLRYANEGVKAFKIGDWGNSTKILKNIDSLGDEFVEIGTKKVSLRKIRHWAEQDNIIGTTSQFSGDIQEILHPKGIDSAFELGRDVGAFIEDHARLTSYTRALRDGYSRKQAKEITFNGLFDYTNLTQFEKKVMKRLIPFYTFGKKNIELQFKTLFTNPGRQANVFKLFKDMQEEGLSNFTPAQREALMELKPEYLKNVFSVPVGVLPNGEIQWMTGFGAPQEDILDLFNPGTFLEGLAFRSSPLLKLDDTVAIKDSYNLDEARLLFKYYLTTPKSQRQFEQYINSKEFQNHPLTRVMGLTVERRNIFKDGKPTKETELVIRANPVLTYALRTTFSARFMSSLRQLGNPNLDDIDLLMKFMAGIHTTQTNLEDSARFEASRIRKAVGEEFKRKNVGMEAMGKVSLFKNTEKRKKLKRLRDKTNRL